MRFRPEFPFWPPGSEPFYTNAASERPDFFIPRCSAPNSRQLGPRSTGNRLGPLLSGHFSDTAPHVCRVFAMRASLHSPRISLPAPAAPRSSAASRRKAAGSDDLPPAGASSTVLAARIRTLLHQRRLRTTRFLHPTLFRSQLPSAGAALNGKPTGAAAFRAFLRHRSTRVPCLRHAGFVALAAHQPAGTGSAQILRSISPKSRRFR